MSPEMHPAITAQRLIDTLISENVMSPDEVLNHLGEKRHSVTLNELELILIDRGVVTLQQLLLTKSALSGFPVFDGEVGVNTRLDPDVVRSLGAFLLDRPSPTVALVEDLPDTIRSLSDILGTEFEVWLIAAPQVDTLFRHWYEQEATEDLPAVESLHELLDETIRRRASDLHLSVGRQPAVRVDGTLIPLARQPLTRAWLESEIESLAGEQRLQAWRESDDVDFSYTYGDARFRVNLGADRFGITVAARKIPTQIPAMDDLGLPRAVQELVELERGLILVVGPTGSGKSTTLASLLAQIVLHQSRHVITLEDPIEFLLPSGQSVVHQRERGWSFSSFPDGLRQALRQDPDVILVGEMRDLDTIRTAITAAETGHLVLATLHTFDAPSTVARVVSSFPAEEQEQVRAQLAYTLKAVVAQTLLPRANRKGRIAAFEVMLSTPAIANNLRRIDGHSRLRQTIETSVQDGMNTMTMFLVDLVRRQMVRAEDAEFRAPDKPDFARRIEAEHL